MQLWAAALLLSGCFRSPHLLTEFEATQSVRGAAEVHDVLSGTHRLTNILARAHYEDPSIGSLKDALRELDCDPELICEDGECLVVIDSDCNMGINGTLVLEEDNGVELCWGLNADRELAPMDDGDVYMWGRTQILPDLIDRHQVRHNLMWAEDDDADGSFTNHCGADFGEIDFDYDNQALSGEMTVRSGQGDVTYETGEYTWYTVEIPFFEAKVAPWRPTEESCLDEGLCWEWTFAPSGLEIANRRPVDGEVWVSFPTPEADEAILEFDDDDVEVNANKRSYSLENEGE